jgi:hypothetical protein
MRVFRYIPFGVLAGLATVIACSATSSDSNEFRGSGTGGAANTGGGGTGGSISGGTGGSISGGTGGGPIFDGSVINPDGGGGQVSGCQAGPDEDKDHDGYSINQGDCNDCDPNANPGAFDVVGGVDGGPGVDEDCDGVVDNEPSDCDTGLSMTSVEPMDFARAIGLCRTADPNGQGKNRTWGVLEARLGTTEINANPQAWTDPNLFGILDRFGNNNKPQEGVKLIALSSGTARDELTGGHDPNGPGGYMTKLSSNYPPGFPKNAAGCPGPGAGGLQANDPVSLYLKIRVPTNAKSFSFNFSFFSAEYPEWVCTEFNDVFVALLHSKVPGNPADDFNISFDQNHNPVCVNIGFFAHTSGSDPVLAKTFLENGNGGATGWLVTQAPVQPGEEITLQFAIWDTGDHDWDSTVIIDNFKWSVEPASEAKTEPVPVPK